MQEQPKKTLVWTSSLVDGWNAVAWTAVTTTRDSPKTTAVDKAISAIHKQHRSDGRPMTFEPFRIT